MAEEEEYWEEEDDGIDVRAIQIGTRRPGDLRLHFSM
jgi:hypothetical protein